MTKTNIRYFKYEDIGKIIGRDIRDVTRVLEAFDIISYGNDPTDLTTFRIKIISESYRHSEPDNYRRYFRERSMKMDNGLHRNSIEVTKEFIEALPALFTSYEDTMNKLNETQNKINNENEASKLKALSRLREKQEAERITRLQREKEWQETNGKKVDE